MKAINIEIAIMEHFGVRQNLIVPNVSWGVVPSLHECDLLILSKSNYAKEVEIKISKADLLKDQEKMHGHVHHYIRELCFAVPIELKEVALANIPERAGLFVVEFREPNPFQKKKKLWTRCVKNAKINTSAHKWSDEERNNLARLGTMRILGLKKKVAQNTL